MFENASKTPAKGDYHTGKQVKVELVIYTGLTGMLNGWHGIPVRLFVPVYSVISGTEKHIGKCRSSLTGKELPLTRTSNTREIGYILVPNAKGKSDLWQHFDLRKRKTDGRIDAAVVLCKRCNSVVKSAGGASNMSTHMRCHHPLLLLGSPVGDKRQANTLVRTRTETWGFTTTESIMAY